MTNLEALVSANRLWMGEEIIWKVKPSQPGLFRFIEAWIKKILRGIKR